MVGFVSRWVKWIIDIINKFLEFLEFFQVDSFDLTLPFNSGSSEAECPKREEGRRPERNATILPSKQPRLPDAAFAKNNTACVKRGGE